MGLFDGGLVVVVVGLIVWLVEVVAKFFLGFQGSGSLVGFVASVGHGSRLSLLGLHNN